MIKVYTTLLFITCSLMVSAQGTRTGRQQMNIGRFYGRILDAVSSKGVDAASVQLILSRYDSVAKTKKDTVVSGMLTNKTGDFSLENLPLFGRYQLRVTAIGYKLIEEPVRFDIKPGGDPGSFASAAQKDLGNFKLNIDPETLESVTIAGTKPLMQMGIDRKIFNVDKNISSTGGTAVDVMRNIPALNVDIDGNVTLRNSAPQIFVDGRPSTLSLDQIPSDAIESVEMITNPSAKYDASGGQSGILNIVLKKNRKLGYNGGIRAGVDTRGKFNGGGDINVRQGKVNMFANVFINQRKSKNWGETDRISLLETPNSTTFQENNGIFNGGFMFTRFGLDYFLDNRNTLSISQNIGGGNFDMDNRNNLAYGNTGSTEVETQYRNTLGESKFRFYSTNLGYKRLFTKPGRELTADLSYNTNRNTNLSDIHIRSFNDPDQVDPKTPEQLQQVNGSGNNKFFTAQADYVTPVNDKIKWEAGVRAQVRNFASSQLNFFDQVPQTQLDNQFEYSDYVYAGYLTYSQKVRESFSYQVGLRAESSSYNGEQIGKDSYENKFPISLFPSIFLTKGIGEKQDLQLNYSRKINRPNFFQLMPNTDFSDTLNLQTGNPDLRPEFTHSLELSYQKTYGKRNNNFLVSLFGKYTTDLIARYQSLREFGDTSAFVSSYINANTAYAAGIELIFRNNLSSWWELNLNTNVYYSKINGSNVVADLENERVSSFTKINNNFKLPAGFTIQLSGDYQSRSALPVSTSNSGGGGQRGGGGWMGGSPSTTQGYIDANYGVDLGLKKDFKIRKNQASLSFNINDIFRTRRYFVHSEAAAFVQNEWRRRDPQVGRLTFSYRFGKMDMSLFKRKNNRTETDSGAGTMEQ